MRALFVDTSFFIALVNTRDEHHQLARECAQKITRENLTCHTSIPIIFEIADGFSKLARREIGLNLITNINNGENYVVHSFNELTYNNALKLFTSRNDKEWGLTDCYSFEIMKEQNISKALTADRHFEQSGFEILLKISD